MSEEGKEAPAVGLGFDPVLARKYRTERLARPSQWSPGVRVQSAGEYDRYTDQLARELLATCTPEHMAVIAAQHMIYADELKCVLEENKADLGKSFEDTFEFLIQASAKAAMIAIEAKRKHSAEKRAAGVRKNKGGVIAHARDIATKEWAKDSEQKIKTGEMAQIVFDALQKTEHCKLANNVGIVRRWIASCAPSYAKKAGPNRKY